MSNSTAESNAPKEKVSGQASGPEPLISLLDILAPDMNVVPGGPALPSETTASKLWASAASAPIIYPSYAVNHGINWSMVLVSAALATVLFSTVGACVAIIVWIRRASKGDEELPRFVRDQRVRRNLAETAANRVGVEGRMGQGQWPAGGNSLIYESPVLKSAPVPQSKKVVNFIQPNNIRSPPMAAILMPDEVYGTEDNESKPRKTIIKTVFTNHSLHAVPL